MFCSDHLSRRERHLSEPHGRVADAGRILRLHVSLRVSDEPHGVCFGRIYDRRLRQVRGSDADLADGRFAHRSLLGRPMAASMDRLLSRGRSSDFVEKDQGVLLHVKEKEGAYTRLLERTINDAAHRHIHPWRRGHAEWKR